MRRGRTALWMNDAAFQAVAKAAWPEDWRAACSRRGDNRRAQARAHLARRYEGFRICEQLERRVEVVKKRVAEIRASVRDLEIAAAALDFTKVQQEIEAP